MLLVSPELGFAAVETAEEAHSEWLPTIAKLVNFAVLAGILVYYLRSPIANYLRTRSETIGKDLVDAASSAETQLTDIRAQLD